MFAKPCPVGLAAEINKTVKPSNCQKWLINVITIQKCLC